MATRITGKRIDNKIAELNEQLNGSRDYYGPGAIVAGHAYEWYAVNLIVAKDGSIKKIVDFGTAREVWDQLNAFMNGVWFQKQLAEKQAKEAQAEIRNQTPA